MVAAYKGQTKQINNKRGKHNFDMEVENKLTSKCMKEVCIFYPAWWGSIVQVVNSGRQVDCLLIYSSRVQEAYTVNPLLSAFLWLHSRKNDEKLNMQMSYNWRHQKTTSEDTCIVQKLMIERGRGQPFGRSDTSTWI